jgi:putative FmdB family regulatory protein
MPQYDFKCNSCGKIFTNKISIKEYRRIRPHLVCPECGCPRISRIYHPIPFRFKEPNS